MIQTRQIIVSRHGGPEVMQEIETGLPDLRDGEVLIRTHFAGVNFEDIVSRVGMNPDAPPPPLVVGYEISGIVSAVSAGVEGLKEGDPVVALTQLGGYSAHVVVNQRYVRKLLENVSLEQAAALPFSYLTAYMLLFRMGSLMTGDTVLVHNAGGAVGSAIVTLARMRGAKVLATASRSKHERVRDLGAQLVIDYNNEDFVTEVQRATGGRGVELVLDAGGPTRFVRSYQVLAPLGKLVMYGVQTSVGGQKGLMDFFGLAWRGWRLNFRPMELMNRNRGVLGLNMGHLWDFPEQAGYALDELVTWLGEEKFAPEIDHTFTYVRAGEAHSYVEGNQNFGQVLLDFRALTPGAPQIVSQV